MASLLLNKCAAAHVGATHRYRTISRLACVDSPDDSNLRSADTRGSRARSRPARVDPWIRREECVHVHVSGEPVDRSAGTVRSVAAPGPPCAGARSRYRAATGCENEHFMARYSNERLCNRGLPCLLYTSDA